ncbi:TIGR02300 family protein [Pseudoxanthobacter sp. M-2]|uniref:TIGR02300 family protein n=1 Tax=Pseudoxanthobacter sp. M-2 TaxID=3078754 RepID=UPI0038FCF990
MAKPELGVKRLCPSCGTKYYDLNRSPILCPKCGTTFDAGQPAVRPEKLAKVVVPIEEVEVDEVVGDVELVSLEEADAEASGGEVVDDIDPEEIAEIDPGEDEFLEEEEGDDDVADIIGDVEDEEER